MPRHRSVERAPQQLGALLDAGGERDEPLRGDEPEFTRRLRLVDQDLWLGNVDGGADERRVQEVDPHAAGLVRHTAGAAALRKLDASERGEVTVPHGDVRVLVLLQRGLDLVQLRRWRLRARHTAQWGGEQRGGDDQASAHITKRHPYLLVGGWVELP